ncbi:MAG: hypothetical protein ACR2H1_14690, partial [Limisphaerales bacterium]
MRGNISPSSGSACLWRVRRHLPQVDVQPSMLDVRCLNLENIQPSTFNIQHSMDPAPPQADATRRVPIFYVTLFFALLNFTLTAQPVPKINSVSPEWIQRGKTTEMIFSGENFSKI